MKARKKQLEGRDHYVVPVTMMVEGVLSGTQGPIFYPADAMKESVNAWNAIPAVVYHPSNSAASPDVFDKQRIGYVFNARYFNSKLLAEVWIDILRARQVDARVVNAIERDQTIEVSTGLAIDPEWSYGVHNGLEFSAIARNFRPDHLAILPDVEGACSIRDGCGLNTKNQRRSERHLVYC